MIKTKNPNEYLNVFAENKKLFTENKDNESRAISPHGIRTALSFIGLGASNDLLTKLINLYESHLDMLDYIKTASNTIDLEEYNGAFIREPLTLAPRFKKMVENYLDINKLSNDVNQIVESKTDIANVFTDDEIELSCMLLLNILKFNDTWVYQFDPANTEVDKFLKNDNTFVDVNMMYQENYLDYYADSNIKAIKLYFKNGAYAEFMMGVDSNIDINNINKLYYSKKKCMLYLPKFKHSETIDLVELFTNADLKELFLQNNLNNLCNDPELYIYKFKQIIKCSFEEKGAQMISITKVCLTRSIQSPPEIIKFNKPFHYRIVKDEKILISGYYNGD